MCSVTISHCDDTECEYYAVEGCTAPEIYHSTDRFCTSGRRKPKDEYERLMREGAAIGYKANGKWISNKLGKILK